MANSFRRIQHSPFGTRAERRTGAIFAEGASLFCIGPQAAGKWAAGKPRGYGFLRTQDLRV